MLGGVALFGCLVGVGGSLLGVLVLGTIANGMALHGGVLPVVGTFLVFADYMRASVRLAALSKAKVVFVWSHDSIGVGEDGPTHQPIEHVASLRAIPDLPVVRPADANEVSQTWRLAEERAGPIAIILTRQNVPVLEGTARPGQVDCGAYVLIDAPDPEVILAGTGSEVTRFTVITDTDTDEKMLCMGLAYVPQAALVDYTLTVTCLLYTSPSPRD